MLNYSANGPSGYNLTNSLRFRASASAYLNRTFGTPTNNKIFTWSAWIKVGTIPSSREGIFVSVNGALTSYWGLEFNASAGLTLYDINAGGASLVTTQVFRDPSSWYHVVVAIDTTQATASNRAKLYINGTQITSFSTATYPAQNSSPYMNTSGNIGYIGNWSSAGGLYLDGYLTEVNFVDGQQLTPSSFGNYNSVTGVWQPAKYTGTYGTNGFYLNFTDIAQTVSSNVGLGKDFSGNANYWVTNNISTTAGTTYDAMTDVPTLTSATVGNYCVLNSASIGADATLSNANLTIAYGSAATRNATMGTLGLSSGKWYWEYTLISASPNGPVFGITNTASASAVSNYPGFAANGWGYAADGDKYNAGIGSAYGASYATNDILGVAFDADAGTLTFYKNNTSQGVAFSGLAADTYFPAFGDGSGTGTLTGAVNFGQRPFTYTPPTGYKALNTFNLPSSTIPQGNKYMDATTYTGNGTSVTVTNAAGFKPDFVWAKNRTNGGQDNGLYDSIRGVGRTLYSNLTNAESGVLSTLTAFNSNGFSGGTENMINQNGASFVGWQWQAGQGSTSSNTSGSITSTVSVNTTAGFSVVTYTGTGTASTVGHGLGVAPKMLIVKNRVQGTYGNWNVWHTTLTGSQYLTLNDTSGASTNNNRWNGTVPTSTVFSVGTDIFGNTNKVSDTYVAYCWAEIAGFSAFGSYTGNGSADGPFVYLGFRPKFVLLFNTAGGDFWYILDSARDTYNATGLYLYPNSSNAEGDLRSTYPQDFLSNGFKIRNASFPNANGAKIIYAAFAENPFKNALAR